MYWTREKFTKIFFIMKRGTPHSPRRRSLFIYGQNVFVIPAPTPQSCSTSWNKILIKFHPLTKKGVGPRNLPLLKIIKIWIVELMRGRGWSRDSRLWKIIHFSIKSTHNKQKSFFNSTNKSNDFLVTLRVAPHSLKSTDLLSNHLTIGCSGKLKEKTHTSMHCWSWSKMILIFAKFINFYTLKILTHILTRQLQ